MEHKGVIYILTNPSFPQFVKIGYADDVEERLNQLNRSECIPYAFRLYAYYRVSARLTDMKLHTLIDSLNPNLRSVEEFNGKTRKREFYAMTAAQAYSILEAIAEINGMKDNLVLVEPTAEDIANEDEAAEIRTRKAPTKYPRMDWMFEQGLVAAGDVLCVINHPEEVATLIDPSTVEYQGKQMTILAWSKKVTGWKAVQTYAMIRQVDSKETLSELREARMRELGMIE